MSGVVEQPKAPEVIVDQILIFDKNNTVDVKFSQKVPLRFNNPFDINYQLQGHPEFEKKKTFKLLTTWKRWYNIRNFTVLGLKVGDDANKNPNLPEFVSIYEFETEFLTKAHGINKNKVVHEPIYNPENGLFVKSVNEKLIFRFTDIVTAPSISLLEKRIDFLSTTVDRAKDERNHMLYFGDIFEGSKFLEGTKKKTEEYKDFLSTLYTSYNGHILDEVEQAQTEAQAEIAATQQN